MKASHQRNIKPGIEYNHLFPKSKGERITVKKRANVDDTIKEIRVIVAETLNQTANIAKVLKGKNLQETLRNNWNFVYDHIQYKEDLEKFEELREPSALWRDRAGDCDCMSIFLSSIMTNQGIPHVLRITKYPKIWPELPRWQHIYPIVPKTLAVEDFDYKRNRLDYFVVDCVVDRFDYEVPYLEKSDYNMDLVRLNGVSDLGLVNQDTDGTLVYSEDVNGIGYIGDAQTGETHEYVDEIGSEVHGIAGNWGLHKQAMKRLNDAQKKAVFEKHRFRSKYGRTLPKVLRGFEGLGLVEHEVDDELIYATDLHGIGYIGCPVSGDLYEYDSAIGDAIMYEAPVEGVDAYEVFGLAGKKQRQARKAEKKVWKAEKKKLKALPKASRREALRQHREKKPRTAAGKLIKKGAHLAMKANPAAATLRNGILAVMKINLFGVAGKLRYGTLTRAEALAAGLDVNKHAKLQKLYNDLAFRFKQAGGEEKNLRKAIMNGKGNKKQIVIYVKPAYDSKNPYYSGEGGRPIHSLPSGNDITTANLQRKEGIKYEVLQGLDDVEYEIGGLGGIGTLGDPATGGLVAAGTAVAAAFAEKIKKEVGSKIFDPKNLQKIAGKLVSGDVLNKQQEQVDAEVESDKEEAVNDLNEEVQRFAPNSQPMSTRQLAALRTAAPGMDEAGIIANAVGVSKSELSTDGAPKSVATNPDPAKEERKGINPWYIVGGLGLLGLGYALTRPDSKGLNGAESKTKKVKGKKKRNGQASKKIETKFKVVKI